MKCTSKAFSSFRSTLFAFTTKNQPAWVIYDFSDKGITIKWLKIPPLKEPSKKRKIYVKKN